MLPHSILHVILKIELHFEVGTTSLLSSMKKNVIKEMRLLKREKCHEVEGLKN